tara:strand:- start:27 stop:644 length:618 start_codon:yes stop_codon:yes gene_type:complete
LRFLVNNVFTNFLFKTEILEKDIITVQSLFNIVERTIVVIGLVAGWLLLLPIIFSRFYDIIARQYTNAQSTTVQFIEWDCFFILVCLIFGFTYFRDGHARIDILRTRFSPIVVAWIEVLGILFLLTPFCLICIIYGIEFANVSQHFAEKWWVPFGEGWMRKSVIPLGFFLLLISAYVVLGRNLIFLRTSIGHPAPQRPNETAHLD